MLKRQSCRPLNPKVVYNGTVADIERAVRPTELQAIDLETTGLDPLVDQIVGIGLANSSGCHYFDWASLADDAKETLRNLVASGMPLVAHNVFFDSAFLQRWVGTWPNFVGCSLVLFKMMASEGWTGQRWGLDVAIDEVLGWPTSNKTTLRELLVKHRLPQDRMSELAALEPQAFGEYCALDALACLQLWQVLQKSLDGLPGLTPVRVWHAQEFMNEIKLLVEQQLRGIHIETEQLAQYSIDLLAKIDQARTKFETHPQVARYIAACQKQALEVHGLSEPSQTTKTGQASKRWEMWNAKRPAIVAQAFNINSKQQLAHMFFSYLFKVEDSWDAKSIVIDVDGHQVTTPKTNTGRPPVHKRLLPQLGEPGRLLAEYNKLLKEEGYVRGVYGRLNNSVLHPQFRVHGTVTGRLGGSGGVNISQQPKTEGYLKTWRAREGMSLVQLDFSAIEPVVLTCASKDPTLMKLYGPAAKDTQDVYLFNGAHIQVFADKIRSYYDPENPTKETLAAAKKYCKAERSANKTVHLAKQYGAGPYKIYHVLRESGFPLDIEIVKQVCDEWDQLYAGTKKFEVKLETEWKSRGGWFYNLLLRPICVAEDKLKDAVNRYCQSSGHDILLKFLCYLERFRQERSITMYPWIVDYHDETIWEVPNDQVEAAKQAFEDALVALNKELSVVLTVPVKGSVEVAQSLAEIKCK